MKYQIKYIKQNRWLISIIYHLFLTNGLKLEKYLAVIFQVNLFRNHSFYGLKQLFSGVNIFYKTSLCVTELTNIAWNSPCKTIMCIFNSSKLALFSIDVTLLRSQPVRYWSQAIDISGKLYIAYGVGAKRALCDDTQLKPWYWWSFWSWPSNIRADYHRRCIRNKTKSLYRLSYTRFSVALTW